jgi:lysophospholipase L1-like esterase
MAKTSEGASAHRRGGRRFGLCFGEHRSARRAPGSAAHRRSGQKVPRCAGSRLRQAERHPLEIFTNHLGKARPQASRVLRWSALAIVVLVCARTAWRLHESAQLIRLSEALQRSPAQPSLRLLIVGDSTAVGTGATAPEASVAGLLGQHFPGLQIVNRARDGAKFGALLDQLDGDERFDMVLVMAGGNDVVRLRGLQALRSDVDRVTQRARQRSDLVVLMPAGNVGNAPFFYAPVSWLMTWRSRRLHAFVSEAASRHGAVVVNLLREAAEDPFVQRPALNAADGLHPSNAGYRVWFGELMAQAALPQRLAAALAPNR